MKDRIKEAYEKYADALNECKETCSKLDSRVFSLENKIQWHRAKIDRLSKSGTKETGAIIQASVKAISKYTDKIEILKSKRKAAKYPYWTHYLLPDIIAELVTATPEIEWKLREHYNVMGLRASSSVWGKTKEGFTVGVTFTHWEGKLYFDTGEVTNRFASGTIGEINSLNNVTEELKELNQLIELIARQTQRAVEYNKMQEDENKYQQKRAKGEINETP